MLAILYLWNSMQDIICCSCIYKFKVLGGQEIYSSMVCTPLFKMLFHFHWLKLLTLQSSWENRWSKEMNSWTAPSGGQENTKCSCRLYGRSLLERGKSCPKVSLPNHQKEMQLILTLDPRALGSLPLVYIVAESFWVSRVWLKNRGLSCCKWQAFKILPLPASPIAVCVKMST